MLRFYQNTLPANSGYLRPGVAGQTRAIVSTTAGVQRRDGEQPVLIQLPSRLSTSASPLFCLFSILKSPKRSAGGILDSSWIRIQEPKARFFSVLELIRRTDWEGVYDRLGGGDATPWEGRCDSSGAPYCDRLGGVCG